jgi:hypothetical protein
VEASLNKEEREGKADHRRMIADATLVRPLRHREPPARRGREVPALGLAA